jgi:large subunit ribosomal protein L1
MVKTEAEEKNMKNEAESKESTTQPKVDTSKPEDTQTPTTETEQKELSLSDSLKLARENSKARKFEQTWDFIINLKGLDLKKPENRFKGEVALPKGRGKQPKIAVFADLMANEAKKFSDLVITKKEIDSLTKNKKRMKKIANEYDFFFGEAPLMPLIGKGLGTVLGPRGKVPKPMPPKGNIEPLLNASRQMVMISLKETPVIYARVGAEKMSDEDIAINIQAVYNFVKDKLPKGKNNIKSMMVKLTMGKPVRVTLR